MNPNGRTALAFLFVVVAVSVTSAWLVGWSTAAQPAAPRQDAPVEPAKPLHPVTILRPGVPRVLTGRLAKDGSPETVGCATCHATIKPNPALTDAAYLQEFHLGLSYNHGKLSCMSCHNENDYDSLRLANGESVSFPNVMKLCAQCHGPQYRDYQHGSHGGMSGYWDLTKGPRQRNNCITCHDPHTPAYRQVLPVFKPKDAPTKSHDVPHLPSINHE